MPGMPMPAGVIDELSLVVDPAIGGAGKPLCMDSRVEEYRLAVQKTTAAFSG